MDQYFWLICGIWCGVLGAGYMRWKLQKNVLVGEFSTDEVASFTRAYALWITIPCVLLWALQQWAGANSPPMYLAWGQPQKAIALALQIFVWAALLWWVFAKNGAHTFSRYLRALRRSDNVFNGPGAIRVAAIAVAVAGVAVVFSGGRV